MVVHVNNLKFFSKTKDGHTILQWIVLLAVNSTMISCGFQTGWISPMTKTLQSDQSPTGRPLTDNELSWLASLLSVMAVFTTPLYSCIADRYGRKAGVIAIAVPQALAWVITLAFPSLPGLIVARILCGIASGGSYNIVPMYTKEISQDDIRGKLGTLVMMFQNIGILTMYALGSYLDYFTVMWSLLSFSLVALLLIIKLPESPAFLVKKGKIDEARETVALLRGLDLNSNIVEDEIRKMTNEELYYKSLPRISYWNIFKNKAWRRSFFIIFALITIQGTSGNYTIINFSSTILAAAGVDLNMELQMLSIPGIMIIGSLISLTCVEIFGRKRLLITALVMSTLSLACIATILLITSQGGVAPNWLPVLTLITIVFAYAAGLLPVPYIVMTEMLNFQIRAKIMGFIVSYDWLAEFAQLTVYSAVSQALGKHTMFYVFTLINLIGLIITIFCLPETKGKSIEEIEEELRNK